MSTDKKKEKLKAIDMPGRNAKGHFEKGFHQTPGVTRKGCRNRFTSAMLKTAVDHLMEKNFNPINEIIALYHGTRDQALKFKILQSILAYTNNPALISMDDDNNIESMEVADRSKLLADLKEVLDNKEQ